MAILSADEFLSSVSKHKMTVLRDDGLYRHVQFRTPGDGNLWFDLTTWPGYLAITGDMDDFVFTRVADMFEFFRRSQNGIDFNYLASKCVACPIDGMREFDEDRVLEVISEQCRDLAADLELTSERGESLAAEALAEYEDADAGSPEMAAMFLTAYEVDIGGRRYRPFEGSEPRWDTFLRLTRHFEWCVRGACWGVGQYDKLKTK